MLLKDFVHRSGEVFGEGKTFDMPDLLKWRKKMKEALSMDDLSTWYDSWSHHVHLFLCFTSEEADCPNGLDMVIENYCRIFPNMKEGSMEDIATSLEHVYRDEDGRWVNKSSQVMAEFFRQFPKY